MNDSNEKLLRIVLIPNLDKQFVCYNFKVTAFEVKKQQWIAEGISFTM